MLTALTSVRPEHPASLCPFTTDAPLFRLLIEPGPGNGLDVPSRGLVHAFPAATNSPSNSICRSLGFRLAGERDVTFADRVLRSNHWVINPATDLA
jgi:hypothetical protein